MKPLSNQHPYLNLFARLTQSTTLLTPNRRLAAVLQLDYQSYQKDNGNRVWPTLDVLPLTSFLQRLWQNYTAATFDAHPLLLSAHQEQLIWEDILNSHGDIELPLLQLSQTAELAKSGWALLRQFDILQHFPLTHPQFDSTQDAQFLRRLVEKLQSILKINHWLDLASLPHQLIHLLESEEATKAQLALPQKIIFVGFNALTPVIERLMTAVTKRGVETSVFAYQAKQTVTTQMRLTLPDAENEFTTMARWAKSLLLKHPQASIGCIVPDLTQKRERVATIFASVFSEDKTLQCHHHHDAFNISAGKPLSSYPIIHTALQLLNLYKNKWPLTQFSFLLHSPYLGDAESEHLKRAQFEQSLRKHNVNQIHLDALLRDSAASLSFTQTCPKLAKHLQDCLGKIKQYDDRLSHHAWCTHFTALLTTMGWPGERSLSSEEYQVVDSWLALLTELTSLDLIQADVSYQDALTSLQRMANKTIFQIQTPSAPIQILGALEAAGLPFDYLFVSGMDDMTWPPQPDPHPLIPKAWQRTFNMPHATAARELTYCQQLLAQYQQTASHIVFSYAEKKAALTLSASQLIRSLPEITIDKLDCAPYQTPHAFIIQSKKEGQWEQLNDFVGPTIHETSKIMGGIHIIKHQALCPFRSFATWRLQAKPLEKPTFGLKKEDRGNLIHVILSKIWDQLKNQATLLALTDEALHDLIKTIIEQVVDSFPQARAHAQQYLDLEKKRLQQLIFNWLSIEKTRPSFTVMGHEVEQTITLNQLSFTARIDRVDQLNENEYLIIDYKTGKNNDVGHWFGIRPDEPQLPLYLLAHLKETVGISFAEVHTQQCGFKGVSGYELDIAGIKPIKQLNKATHTTWDAQRLDWESTLKQLSDDFYQGIAYVDPKEGEQTCTYCQLQSLCRIHEEMSLSHAE